MLKGLLLLAGVFISPSRAQDVPPNERFEAPPPSDFIFLSDDVFTGQCVNDGTFEFTIEIHRDIGDMSKLRSSNSIPKFMYLEGAAFFQGDIDGFCQRVYFNSRRVPSPEAVEATSPAATRFFQPRESCVGQPCDKVPIRLETWVHQKALIETEHVEFASYRNGILNPGINTIRIELEPLNEEGTCGPILIRDRNLRPESPQGEPEEQGMSRRLQTSCLAWDKWFAINLRNAPSLPVLLVHGTSFGASIAAPPDIWNFWKTWLSSRGIPVDATLNLGTKARIATNANRIGKKVSELKERYGVNKVKVATHNKGGVDSRHYVEPCGDRDCPRQGTGPGPGPDAQSIISLAGLHVGSKWYNRGFRVGNLLSGPVTLVSFTISGQTNNNDGNLGGQYQMTTNYMRRYNQLHGINPRVSYYAQAGDYSAKGRKLRKRIKWFARRIAACGVGRECDGIVSVPSAFFEGKLASQNAGLSWTREKFSCKGGNKECRHKNIPSSMESFDKNNLQTFLLQNLRPLVPLRTRRLTLEGDRGDRLLQENQLCSFEEDEEDDSLVYVATLAGSVEGNLTTSIDFVVDEPTLLIVTLFFPAGEAETDLHLVTPSGMKITRDDNTEIDEDGSQDDFDNVQELLDYLPSDAVFFEEGGSTEDEDLDLEEGQTLSHTFYIAEPEVGSWMAGVTNPSLQSTESMDFMLTVEYIVSSLEFTAQLLPDPASVGEPLSITARLFDGADPITEATVTARVYRIDDFGLVGDAINLFDDGSGDDSNADDGTYTAPPGLQLDRGEYFVQMSAVGIRPSTNVQFTREYTLFATILTDPSSIIGVDGDRVEDFDADGLFDALIIDASLNITTPGFYRVFGIIEDSEGNQYQSGGTAELDEGQQVFPLQFDGSNFVRNQANCPYNVAVIRLADADEDGTIIGLLDELCPVDYEIQSCNVEFEVDEAEREPPTANCMDVEVPADPGQCVASDVSINDGSTTAEGLEGLVTQYPKGPYTLGETPAQLEVLSIYGNIDSCFGSVLVKDEESPSISCAVRDISVAEVPLTFNLGATDNCDTEVTVEEGFDCWKVDDMGNKMPSPCVIEFQDNSVNIVDSGGAGTKIELRLQATDSSGNVETKTCSLTVLETTATTAAPPTPSLRKKPTTSSTSTSKSSKVSQGSSKSSKAWAPGSNSNKWASGATNYPAPDKAWASGSPGEAYGGVRWVKLP